MKIKTNELTYPALDWAVMRIRYPHNSLKFFLDRRLRGSFHYSTDWSQGGPIIEREGIAIHPSPTWTARYGLPVLAHHGGFRGRFQHIGATPLIAAMRCFVASKLGDEVDVPEELL